MEMQLDYIIDTMKSGTEWISSRSVAERYIAKKPLQENTTPYGMTYLGYIRSIMEW